jgi:hypothetical protein
MSIHRFARRATVTAGAAAAVLVSCLVSGCSSDASVPTAAFPSPTAPQVYAVTPAPAPTYTGYAPPLNDVTTAISGLSANMKMVYPMQWVTFTVTLDNMSDFPFVNIEPLVVFGQCACDPKYHSIAPSATVEYLPTGTHTWTKIALSTMDSTGSYQNWNQIPSVNLGPNATRTLTYRMQMNKSINLKPGLVTGAGSLDIFVLQEPGRTRLSVGAAPDATVPLTYVVG